MKKSISFFRNIYLFLFIIVVSCNSDEVTTNNPKVKLEHLVDYEKVKSIDKTQIQSTLAFLNMYNANLPKNRFTSDVDFYTIKYNTTFEGKKIIASGLVVIPNKSGDFPLLSFQNGTNTEHRNAPSVNYFSENFQLLGLVSSSGFIVSVPDYLGFGASKNMFHPYMDKKSTVSSVVDMLKAVKELTSNDEIKAKANKDLYLNGYSQGGWATMCVQKALETDNQNLFNLKASSCGAGPYNLEIVLDFALQKQTYNNPYFLAYVFQTMIKMNKIDKTDVEKILKKPYSDRIYTLFDGNKTGNDINNLLSTNVKDIFTDNFLKDYKTSDDFKKVRLFLKNNSVGFWKTSVPTKLFHGNTDEDVPLANSEEAYQEMLKLGVEKENLEFYKIPNSNHYQAFIPSEIATLQWFLYLTE